MNPRMLPLPSTASASDGGPAEWKGGDGLQTVVRTDAPASREVVSWSNIITMGGRIR
jgi:hypothetical protein